VSMHLVRVGNLVGRHGVNDRSRRKDQRARWIRLAGRARTAAGAVGSSRAGRTRGR
jgi:hypothetical protein